jgi:hypothetical protein
MNGMSIAAFVGPCQQKSCAIRKVRNAERNDGPEANRAPKSIGATFLHIYALSTGYAKRRETLLSGSSGVKRCINMQRCGCASLTGRAIRIAPTAIAF